MEKLRMPAEWEKHRATWISWPHNQDDWPGKFDAIPWVYAEIVRVLSNSEVVEIICDSEIIVNQARDYCGLHGANLKQCRFHIIKTDRSWLRDSMPTAVVAPGSGLKWVRWYFNAWAKYENHLLDRGVPGRVSELTGLPLINAITEAGHPFVLEGGAIDTDGQGTLLVTEECLLSSVQQRNQGLTREDYEELFYKYLGAQKTIWLGKGCVGDDTHGHIDDVARFVAPGKVVLAVEPDVNDENHKASMDNLERLGNSQDAKGNPVEVVKIPMPRAIFYDGERLPASYANFYIANKVVLVPTFNDPNDRIALETLQRLFPERSVVGISSVDLVLGLGTLHCLTQQEPANA